MQRRSRRSRYDARHALRPPNFVRRRLSLRAFCTKVGQEEGRARTLYEIGSPCALFVQKSGG